MPVASLAGRAPAPPQRRGLTSGALSAQAGLSRGALRLYERAGLLAPPPRTRGGYRLYPPEALELLLVVRTVKALGFSLSEIKALIDLMNRDGLTDATLRSIAAERLEAIDAKIAGLSELRRMIVDCVENPGAGEDEDCAIALRLARGGRPPRRSSTPDAESRRSLPR
jgi:MerR family mercuric resistance operon transcriptional regulator